MSYVKCLCWSLGHAEQLLFSSVCSKLTVYCWKLQCFFLDHILLIITLTCEFRCHRAGSQLLKNVWTSDKSWDCWWIAFLWLTPAPPPLAVPVALSLCWSYAAIVLYPFFPFTIFLNLEIVVTVLSGREFHKIVYCRISKFSLGQFLDGNQPYDWSGQWIGFWSWKQRGTRKCLNGQWCSGQHTLKNVVSTV